MLKFDWSFSTNSFFVEIRALTFVMYCCQAGRQIYLWLMIVHIRCLTISLSANASYMSSTLFIMQKQLNWSYHVILRNIIFYVVALRFKQLYSHLMIQIALSITRRRISFNIHFTFLEYFLSCYYACLLTFILIHGKAQLFHKE